MRRKIKRLTSKFRMSTQLKYNREVSLCNIFKNDEQRLK